MSPPSTHRPDQPPTGICRDAAKSRCNRLNGRRLHTKSRFTLVEVLVVGGLASIPVLATRRTASSARTSACLANLRGMHIIAAVEATDCGFYPPALSQTTGPSGIKSNGDHFSGLTDSLSCTACPDAKIRGVKPKNGRPIAAYVTNETDGTPQPPFQPFVKPYQITRPSEVFLLSDNAQHSDGTSGAVGFYARWWGNQTGIEADKEKPMNTSHVPAASLYDNLPLIPFRHDGKANLVFVDGHAIMINRPSDLKEKNLYWNC